MVEFRLADWDNNGFFPIFGGFVGTTRPAQHDHIPFEARANLGLGYANGSDLFFIPGAVLAGLAVSARLEDSQRSLGLRAVGGNYFTSLHTGVDVTHPFSENPSSEIYIGWHAFLMSMDIMHKPGVPGDFGGRILFGYGM